MNMINKYYFINKFDTNIINKQDKQTAIIYRNYDSKIIDKLLILKIKKYCRFKNIKFYLSNNIKLALKLDLDGAYIPSFNKNFQHLSYKFKREFELIGSAHNLKEIRIKEQQRVKSIFLSSLFKKNKNYLGLYRFKKLKNLTKKNVIALGGITKNNKKKIKMVNCESFAGITYFKKKAPTS